MQKTIFVVDDSLTNLSKAEEALEKQYRVITLLSVQKMQAALEKITPNLILLDIAMPEMSGFEAMKQLKANKLHADIPVIFLTALTDSYNEALGIELGAVDFITKPFSEPVLLNRIKNHLNFDDLVHKRTERLMQLNNDIVFTLADIIERRDKNTTGHIERTTFLLKNLLNAMIERGVYIDELRGWDINLFISATLLHDVGKITIPEHILNKPEKLTDEEFQVVKNHATEGKKIISQSISRTGETGILQNAKSVAAYHHERWDGSGYPYGLKGAMIPLQGRIMAIVDVYDALVSERPYKKAFTHDKAIQIIREGSGKHFDPLIADVFCEINVNENSD